MSKITISQLPNVDFNSFTESGNDLTVTRVYTGSSDPDVSRNDLLALRNAYISNKGYYQSHGLKAGADNGKGGTYDIITVTTIDLNVTMQNGYYSVMTGSANLSAIPLERKTVKISTGSPDLEETYKTWWNHHVVSTTEGETITEANWKAITDGKRPAGAADGVRWVKTNQALKAGEFIILRADMPGTQSYLHPVNEVTETLYSRQESVVKQILLFDGWRRAPRNHAGVYYDDRKDNENWLIVSATYRKVNGWYEATLKYKYAEYEWNEKLYPTAEG